MPADDTDDVIFTLRILGMRLRARLQPSAPAADAVAGDQASETTASLVLIRNSWANLSLPVSYSRKDAEEVQQPTYDPVRAKEIWTACYLFACRALWCLGCVGVIVASIFGILAATRVHADVYEYVKCGGVCGLDTRAWLSKNVEVVDTHQDGPHVIYLFDEKPTSTYAANFSTNVTMEHMESAWPPWQYGPPRRIQLLQRGGDHFTFDVNLTATKTANASVIIRMDSFDGMNLFKHTLFESGRIDARIPNYFPSLGAFEADLSITLVGYSGNRTAQIQATGETSKYNVTNALAFCPPQYVYTPYDDWKPCNFTAPSAFRSAHIVLQEPGDFVGGMTRVEFHQHPRILAFVSLYLAQTLAILTAVGTLALILWHRRTPVEIWRMKKDYVEVRTDEEHEPLFGGDV
ncbi:hypothetical protein HK101_011263 [Irineochytrium annulatum]|nr:hypothetical protein HK101_011263 [Irineochytrium annulatum]